MAQHLKTSHIGEETRNRFKELWKGNKHTTREIAEKLQLSYDRVTSLRKDMNLQAKGQGSGPKRKLTITPEEIETRAKAVRETWSDSERSFRARNITDANSRRNNPYSNYGKTRRPIPVGFTDSNPMRRS